MNKLLIICGATATGKTKLAIDCAKQLNTDIISADSQLIYKNLDIGTAKPTKDEMAGVVHHMIDVIEPSLNFSVSDYCGLAEPIINRLFKENKVPVICGGTGFYINSLIYDLSYGNTAANQSVREKYNDLLRKRGKEYLYDYLLSVDPQTAKKLHENDTKRVIRALEIYEVSGRKKSDIVDDKTPKYEYTAVGVDYPREELYERINRRVDGMFNSGLVEEVIKLIDSGITADNQCMQAIGYKEVLECIKNGDNESTMRNIIKQNTRHYAKRQITFFKKLEGIIWLKPDDATPERVLELFNGQ